MVLELPPPPSNIGPEGEAQLECLYLIIIIIINTELKKDVAELGGRGKLGVGWGGGAEKQQSKVNLDGGWLGSWVVGDGGMRGFP